MSGDGDSEDAVGGLASLLLGQEGGGGKAFEGFLAGHGVELGNAEENDDNKDAGEGDGNETDSRPTKKPKANPTRKESQNPATTTSSNTVKSTSTPRTSRARSKPSQTAVLQSPSPTRTSPIVVPSPPPPAASLQPSRKRRAPSFDEPSRPEPPQIASATSSAKPPAKRSRATPSRSETPADEPDPVPTRRRTTRSAVAAGKGGG